MIRMRSERSTETTNSRLERLVYPMRIKRSGSSLSGDRRGIQKTFHSFLESNFVLREVGSGLIRVPFKVANSSRRHHFESSKEFVSDDAKRNLSAYAAETNGRSRTGARSMMPQNDSCPSPYLSRLGGASLPGDVLLFAVESTRSYSLRKSALFA
jgi:hypothetical protein